MVGSLGLGASGSVMICNMQQVAIHHVYSHVSAHACQLDAEKCTAVRAATSTHQPRTANHTSV